MGKLNLKNKWQIALILFLVLILIFFIFSSQKGIIGRAVEDVPLDFRLGLPTIISDDNTSNGNSPDRLDGSTTIIEPPVAEVPNQTGPEENQIIIPSNSCTPPKSGNWEIFCSDGCSWTVNQTVPGNMSITGSGELNLSAYLVFVNKDQYITITPKCQLNIFPDGGFA